MRRTCIAQALIPALAGAALIVLGAGGHRVGQAQQDELPQASPPAAEEMMYPTGKYNWDCHGGTADAEAAAWPPQSESTPIESTPAESTEDASQAYEYRYEYPDYGADASSAPAAIDDGEVQSIDEYHARYGRPDAADRDDPGLADESAASADEGPSTEETPADTSETGLSDDSMDYRPSDASDSGSDDASENAPDYYRPYRWHGEDDPADESSQDQTSDSTGESTDEEMDESSDPADESSQDPTSDSTGESTDEEMDESSDPADESSAEPVVEPAAEPTESPSSNDQTTYDYGKWDYGYGRYGCEYGEPAATPPTSEPASEDAASSPAGECYGEAYDYHYEYGNRDHSDQASDDAAAGEPGYDYGQWNSEYGEYPEQPLAETAPTGQADSGEGSRWEDSYDWTPETPWEGEPGEENRYYGEPTTEAAPSYEYCPPEASYTHKYGWYDEVTPATEPSDASTTESPCPETSDEPAAQPSEDPAAEEAMSPADDEASAEDESGLELFAWLPGELLSSSDQDLLVSLARLCDEPSSVRRAALDDYLEGLGSEAIEFATQLEDSAGADVPGLADDVPGVAAFLGCYRLMEREELGMEEASDLLRRSLPRLSKEWTDGVAEMTAGAFDDGQWQVESEDPNAGESPSRGGQADIRPVLGLVADAAARSLTDLGGVVRQGWQRLANLDWIALARRTLGERSASADQGLECF